MPKIKRPYSRVYWEVLDDPKFEGVWDDDRALATWLRMLIAADMAWPASASLYHGVHRPSLDRLVKARLVDMQGTSRYRIHGLDKERQQRSDEARAAVSSRYDRSTPVERSYTDDDDMRTTERLPSQAEPSKDEQSKAEQSTGRTRATDDPFIERPDDDVVELQVLAENLTGTPYGFPAHGPMGLKAAALAKKHGRPAVEREWRRIAVEEGGMPTVRQLVLGADNALNRVSGPPAPLDPKAATAEFVARMNREAEEAKRARTA